MMSYFKTEVMKKVVSLFMVTAFSCSLALAQNLIRVNNNGYDPDYTTLAAAVAAATAGDTIYVEGSVIEYAGGNIAKKITVIGPGYFLSENPSTQATKIDAKFSSDISFITGSAGSTIMGCHLASVGVKASNISIRRNLIDGNILIGAAVSNISILQNCGNSILAGDYDKPMTNSVISNNFLYQISAASSSGSMVITNNILLSNISVYNSNIQNNIVAYSYGGIAESTGNNISYNLMAIAGTNSNHNQYSVDMTAVFVDFNGVNHSYDGKWQLAEGSVAKGAGSGGVDCGLFGGSTPYVLSGIPDLPHIYEADIPATANTGSSFGISIKVKSGN